MKLEVKNSDDLISDSIDAFCNGDTDYASTALRDAIEMKLTNHFCQCLEHVYGPTEG